MAIVNVENSGLTSALVGWHGLTVGGQWSLNSSDCIDLMNPVNSRNACWVFKQWCHIVHSHLPVVCSYWPATRIFFKTKTFTKRQII